MENKLRDIKYDNLGMNQPETVMQRLHDTDTVYAHIHTHTLL